MAVNWPSEIPSGQENEKFGSNLDLGLTFLDIAGMSFSKEVDEESTLPLCKEQALGWRSEQFCEVHGHFTSIVGRVLITEQYKYVFNEGY